MPGVAEHGHFAFFCSATLPGGEGETSGHSNGVVFGFQEKETGIRIFARGAKDLLLKFKLIRV